MKTLKFTFLVLFMTLAFAACNPAAEKVQTESAVAEKGSAITENEVVAIQQVWSEGIVSIGKVYLDGGDYVAAAENHIDKLYGFELGKVLFKPTLASEKQFRLTKESALSYFVGKNPDYTEDHGFAIKPWSAVRWESAGITVLGNVALAMGNYYFTPAKGGDEVKVEYSFAYVKDENGNLKIVLHDSHVPYAAH
ncbi:MAG: hypothetical protein Q7V19_10095 [Bacteroidales bacterium]|nr:hypothetical protein [Bacteroidales bacterium]